MTIGFKEWTVLYKDHEIRVVNTWFSGARLYLDGVCVDQNNALFLTGKKTPSLTAPLNGKETVNVDLLAIAKTKARIRVNEQRIGGDLA